LADHLPNCLALSSIPGQVHVLGSGLRHPVPAASDGGALQEALQHIWQPIGVHCGSGHPAVWWRGHPGTASADQVSRLRRGDEGADVPLPHHGHVAKSDHPGFGLLVD